VVDEPRPYREESDLRAMRRILIAGRAARGPTYYVHIGDLNWWLFCSETADDFRPRTFLWVARYLCFMRSPVYDPEPDVVAVAPGGQVAAFCACWLDEANRVGHFEPVGTRPAFRQRGLGKAVLWVGRRRLAARGMWAATVCVEADNAAARRLHGAVGLQPAHGLLTSFKEGNHHA
jgi:ribosomal protein S18 acetylase RimI-like enzyme